MEVPAELDQRADDYISHYPDDQKRSATLPLLHLLQEEFGFITEDSVDWVAMKLELEPINVLEVVTFYPGLRQTAPGKYHIRVCRTLSCAMAGLPCHNLKFLNNQCFCIQHNLFCCKYYNLHQLLQTAQ